jgi:hypothetical protein
MSNRLSDIQQLYQIYLLQNCGCTHKDLIPALRLRSLKRRGLVYEIKKYIYLTDQGQEIIDAAIVDPRYCDPTERSWRIEALTGTQSNGHETQIINAVIPSGEKQQESSYEIDESDYTIVSIIREIAKNINKSEMYVAEAYADERLDRCSSCRRISVFRRDKLRKNGLQSACISCQDARKEKN